MVRTLQSSHIATFFLASSVRPTFDIERCQEVLSLLGHSRVDLKVLHGRDHTERAERHEADAVNVVLDLVASAPEEKIAGLNVFTVFKPGAIEF